MRYLHISPRTVAMTLAVMAGSVSVAMAGNGGPTGTDAPYGKTYGGGTAGTQPTEFIDVSAKLADEKPDLAKLMQSFQSPAVKTPVKSTTY